MAQPKKNAAFLDLVWPNGLREEIDPVLTSDKNDFPIYLIIAWIFVVIYFLLKKSLAHEVRP